MKTILFSSWVNLLLVFVPVVIRLIITLMQGIATHAAGVNATIVFSMNCVAVVPLAAVSSFLSFC